MMRYLLDTNAILAILKGPHSKILQRLRTELPEDVMVPSLAVHELFYGAFRSHRVEHNLAIVDGLQFEVMNFDREDARHAGEIRAQLAKNGTPIGAHDVLIAGQARARGLVLVTRNTREFNRVSDLRVENWED